MPLIWDRRQTATALPRAGNDCFVSQFRCLCFSSDMKGFIFSVYDQTLGTLSQFQVEEQVGNWSMCERMSPFDGFNIPPSGY